MRDGWVETTFGDIFKIVAGKYVAKEEYVEGGEFWIYGSNSIMGKIDRFLVEQSHVVMAAIGAYAGAVRYSKEPSWINNNAMALVPSEKVMAKYLHLWLESKFDLKRVVVGTGQPYVQRPLLLKELIALPPLPEQKRVVDLISSVDSYIEALQQQLESAKRSRNAVLHALMNQALDEDRKPLIELAKLQRGHDLPTQDRIEGSIPVVASNGVVGFHNTHKAVGPGVVTGRSGTIGKVIYIDDDYWPLNTTLYVIDFKGNLPKFVALVLETLKLENYAGGSTVPSLDRKVLSQVPVPFPSIKEQERIVGIIESLDEVVAKSEQAISQAKILRTGLLSDLLSGDHKIPESYDKVIGAA